jgi:signal transduction histidine kinase/CheY-like chemotaxis protein
MPVHSESLQDLRTIIADMRAHTCRLSDEVPTSWAQLIDRLELTFQRVQEQLAAKEREFQRLAAAQAEAIVRSAEVIDELEAIKKELELSRENAEAAAIAKSQFLANVSHEMRTPLNGILGFADMLLQGFDEGNGAMRRDYLRTIQKSGRHLLHLINDTLDISRIEANRLQIEIVPCSPDEIIADVVELLGVDANAKGLLLSADCLGGVTGKIQTDPHRLRQIVMNLVGNAIKFTEQGSVRVTMEFLDTDSAPKLRIRVADTGIGIASDKLESIFDPFTQADNSITRRFGGTGLGLAISQRLAEALGGELTVQSELGEGTQFELLMQLSEISDMHRVRRELSAEKSDEECECAVTEICKLKAKILIVEDVPTNQLLLSHALTRAGAEIQLAANGEIAVEMALHTSFDVILMDMQMPVMDGYTATRLLREKGLTLPIIALTAHSLDGDQERCLACGCSGFLTKPVAPDALLHTVQAMLDVAEESLRAVVCGTNG